MTSKVVIVEDEDSIALALQVLLERDGHEVARMANGAEASPGWPLIWCSWMRACRG
jgi:DNA-binding NtrC family response regulator